MEATDYVARFWSRVEKSEGCWLWTRGKTTAGYGMFSIKKRPRCDNPACVRHDHLFLGTHGENMRDMSAKGRSGITRKLTDQQIAEARARRADGESVRSIAGRLGLREAYCSRILTGGHWANLPDAVPANRARPHKRDEAIDAMIVRLHLGGETQAFIGAALGLSMTTVGSVLIRSGHRQRTRCNTKRAA